VEGVERGDSPAKTLLKGPDFRKYDDLPDPGGDYKSQKKGSFVAAREQLILVGDKSSRSLSKEPPL